MYQGAGFRRVGFGKPGSCLFFLGGDFAGGFLVIKCWAVLSDEQMRKIWPFSLLNDERMSNKVGVSTNQNVIVPTNDIGTHDTSKKDRLERFDGRVIPKVCMSLAGTINVFFFNRGHQK